MAHSKVNVLATQHPIFSCFYTRFKKAKNGTGFRETMSKEAGVPNSSPFYGYYRIEMALDFETEAIGSGPISDT